MLRLLPDTNPPRRARIGGWGGDELTIHRNREHVVVKASDGASGVMLLLTPIQALNAASMLRIYAQDIDPFDACRALDDDERAEIERRKAPVDGEERRV